MTDTHSAFTGSIPENYDRYLGPILFDPYALDLAARLTVPDDAAVLEMACGTGILTRQLRNTLPPSVKFVATDLNQDMLDFARRKFDADEAIVWQQADATSLPFADDSFDAVVCQFGLMFFPDKSAAVREAHRLLKPGGAFLFSVWDAIEKNELGYLAHETISGFFENDPPRFYLVPFGYHDPNVIQGLLQEAGFRNIHQSIVAKTGESPSAQDAARGVVEGNPVADAIRERGQITEEVINAVHAALASRLGDKPLRARMQALVFSATKGDIKFYE